MIAIGIDPGRKAGIYRVGVNADVQSAAAGDYRINAAGYQAKATLALAC